MLTTVLVSLTVALSLLLVAVVAMGRRVQADLEAELAGERQRADALHAELAAEARRSLRFRREVIELRSKLTAAPVAIPVPQLRLFEPVAAELELSDAEVDAMFASAEAREDLPTVTDAELEKLFAE
jgi:hypothetical protein